MKKKLILEFENANRKPSEVRDDYWVYAERKEGEYPQHTDKGGKWLIFVELEKLDNVWEKIKEATEKGLLGEYSKCAAALYNSYASDPQKKVICVYTYDYTDKEDVMKIRQALRNLGIKNKIPYKTDDATIRGEYRTKGFKRISVYYGYANL